MRIYNFSLFYKITGTSLIPTRCYLVYTDTGLPYGEAYNHHLNVGAKNYNFNDVYWSLHKNEKISLTCIFEDTSPIAQVCSGTT